MHFYHGTRWSIAKKIPKNVKPIGGGDFASGFYTHVDTDNSKAHGRALSWGRRMANMTPREPYAGVVEFKVKETDYKDISVGNKGRKFNLKNVGQSDYNKRQKEWLDFVTSHGRQKNPTFNPKREQWIHERREPQPNLPYNVIEGPFYSPIKGTKEDKPRPEDFRPYAEGKQLPQQVAWANEGITLLNSEKVETNLSQYDARTGKEKKPHADTAASDVPLNVEQMTERAQLGLAVGGDKPS